MATIPHSVGTGQMQELTSTQISTKYGAAVHTPTGDFTFVWKGQHYNFKNAVPAVVSNSAMLSAMIAAGCPIA